MYVKDLKKLRSQLSEQRIVFNSEKAGWKTRSRKLDLFQFLNLFISQRPNNHLSLNDMRQELFNDDLLISKEGINKRINDKAVVMIKLILGEIMELNLLQFYPTTNDFSSIILTDSTSFQLPGRLNDSFKGFGGNHGIRGGVKVQYQMSLTNGKVKMDTVSAAKSDQKTEIIQPKKGELHLFDLGYFSFPRLNEFEQKKAFYLCRLKVNTLLWIRKNNQWHQLTWREIAKLHRGHKTLEIEVFLGQDRQVKTRLFIEKISANSSAQKRRKVKRYAQRHGRIPTQKHLTSCDFSAHISNVPPEILTKENARKIYSLRWQIEIQFKTWKSFMNIDKIFHMNRYRFECHHYGTLIYILLCGKIFYACKQEYWREYEVELSELKAMKFLARNKSLVHDLIFQQIATSEVVLMKMNSVFRNTCIKEFKKHRQTPMNIMKYCLS
ncbi:MAG: IS4 family transposase [Flavobacteriales bacterium]